LELKLRLNVGIKDSDKMIESNKKWMRMLISYGQVTSNPECHLYLTKDGKTLTTSTDYAKKTV
jgi:hypothetical protein